MMPARGHLASILTHLLFLLPGTQGTPNPPGGIDWGQWWTYDGISGPRFWGVINPEWAMCKDGRRQSPIDINPDTLLYDPNLTPFTVDKVPMRGVLINTGHSVEWRVASGAFSRNSTSRASSSITSLREKRPSSTSEGLLVANITGGPLSYLYTVTHARVHFGAHDGLGSEHTLDGHTFPAELQMFGYNSQLYRNFSHAVGQVNGLVAIAVLIKLGSEMTPEFKVMLQEMEDIKFGGSFTPSPSISMSNLLPFTEHYMTYEGSLTEPGCQETVTWIIPNKPIYMTPYMMHQLRSLRQGRLTPLSNAPIANNFRPTQIPHHRTIRTNISVNKHTKLDPGLDHDMTTNKLIIKVFSQRYPTDLRSF